MRRTLSVLTIATVVIGAGAIAGSAASPKTPPSSQEIAKRILATPAGNALTPTARIALEAMARGDHRAAPDSTGISPAVVRQAKGLKPAGRHIGFHAAGFSWVQAVGRRQLEFAVQRELIILVVAVMDADRRLP